MLIPIIGVIDRFLSKIILVTRGYKIVRLRVVFVSCRVLTLSSWSHRSGYSGFCNLLCFRRLPHIWCKLPCLDCTLFSVSVMEHNLTISPLIAMWEKVFWLPHPSHSESVSVSSLIDLSAYFSIGSRSIVSFEIQVAVLWHYFCSTSVRRTLSLWRFRPSSPCRKLTFRVI